MNLATSLDVAYGSMGCLLGERELQTDCDDELPI